MRGTRTILAAALLTGLPVAAHSQGMRAPADALFVSKEIDPYIDGRGSVGTDALIM